MPSIVDKSSVKKVCVDDFALRKRFSYGTVMVDLESHKIIDLIPTRNTNEVKEWSYSSDVRLYHNYRYTLHHSPVSSL